MDKINKTARQYACWKLSVTKNRNAHSKSNTKTYDIYVMHEKYEQTFENDKKNVFMEVKKLSMFLMTKYRDKQETIKKKVIKPIIEAYHKNVIDQFANVSYGYAITCHKGQGSNFYDTFVDLDDILKNINVQESKHCLYTAVTRTSNKLYMLVRKS